MVVSKYRRCWENILANVGGGKCILENVRKGKAVVIQADNIRQCGNRKGWGGNVTLSHEKVVRGNAAHLNSLKHFLCPYIRPDEYIQCKMTGEIGNLSLIVRLREAKEIELTRSVAFLQPKEAALEMSSQTENVAGRTYRLVSSFERELREFIIEMLGKGWRKRLQNDLPFVVSRWADRRKRDEDWGIDPENRPIDYADITDYSEIIQKYQKIFAPRDDKLAEVVVWLKIFTNYGRNPVMHCRTITERKFDNTESAVKYLTVWIQERKQRRKNDSSRMRINSERGNF